ncbi:diguanylate cyclase [Planomonospora sp. ID67723]|uniref:histidine kinase N-terminal 7TM domain-containing diguanylate cyclase n=1 Tax=Planomonospora sp. ID67723 TaxID=2738134 RepID=UPI0018C38E84|nr:diguanylate cyclase [Planomonospora sp. ID67723]MBG0826419.1 diguanylate cyclase [Planomonospora sp. ID67723]
MGVFLAVAFAVSAAVAGAVAVVSRLRRESPLSGVNTFMGAGTAVMSVMGMVQVLASGPTGAWLAATASTVASAAVVAGVLCLSKIVANRAWRVSRRAVLLLAADPAAAAGLALTNPWHHLLFARAEPAGPEGMLVSAPGPLFWPHMAYVYVLLSVSLALVVRARRQAPPGRRQVHAWTITAFTPPVAANIAGMSLPVRLPDLTAIGLSVTMVIAYGALVRSLPQRQIQVAHGQVFDTISDAVGVIDRSGRVLNVNASARELLRRAGFPDEVTGKSLHEIPGFGFALSEDGSTDQTVTDVLGRGVDLHVRTSVVRDRRGQCVGWVLVTRDVTELNRRRHEAEKANVRLREQLETIEALRADLAEQAVRDPLTGLHNRRHLLEALTREVARAAEEGTPLGLALVDVDHFKGINDAYGHGGGDVVLVHIARLLAGEVRHDDVVARYGGEEFVLMLPGATAESAWERVDELRRRVGRAAIGVGGGPLSVTFSGGVAALLPGQSPSDLLRAADEALYEAKRLGRDRVERAAPRSPGAGAAPRSPGAGAAPCSPGAADTGAGAAA